jgi:predicted ribosomally synthesized peptide with SipW-like signal peptide
MFKFSFKIHVITLMLFLSLGCLIPTHSTFAFFSDSTNSSNNSFRVGILSNMVQEEGWMRDGEGIDSSPLLELGDMISRTVARANSGTMDFQYNISVDPENDDLGSLLEIQAIRNGEEKYRGPLSDLSMDNPIVLGVAEAEEWIFTVTLVGQAEVGGQYSFDIVFQSWQLGFNWGEGFSHTSRVKNTLEIEGLLIDTEEQVDDLPEEQVEFNLEELSDVSEEDESDESSELLETAEEEDLSPENDEENLDNNQNDSMEGNDESDDSLEETELSDEEELEESVEGGLSEDNELSDLEEGELQEDDAGDDSVGDNEASDLEEEELLDDNSDEENEENVEDGSSEDIPLDQEGEPSNDDAENTDEAIDDSGEDSDPDLDSGDLNEPVESEENYADLPEEPQSDPEPEPTEEISSGNQESDSNNQNEEV